MIVDLIGAAVMSALVSVWLIIRMRAIPRETGVRLRLGRMIGVWALVYCGVMAPYLAVQYLYPSERRGEALIRALFLAFPLAPMCFVMVFALAVESIQRQKGCGRFFWRPVDAAGAAEAHGR